MLEINPGLIIWTIITFVIVLVILRATAWKPLLGALTAREEKIRSSLKDAQDAQQQARALLEGLQAPPPLVDKVCAILDGQAPPDSDMAREHALVADAAAIAELEEQGKQDGGASVTYPQIQTALRSEGGKAYARKVFPN